LEQRFAERVFVPLTSGNGFDPFDYGPWLAQFAASLSWRSLIFLLSMSPMTQVPRERSSEVDSAGDAWNRFLLHNQPTVTPYDQHLIPLGYLDSHTVIEDTAFKDVDRTANSGTFEAMLHDVELFGREAFGKPDLSA
jgi:hypothetical protein